MYKFQLYTLVVLACTLFGYMGRQRQDTPSSEDMLLTGQEITFTQPTRLFRSIKLYYNATNNRRCTGGEKCPYAGEVVLNNRAWSIDLPNKQCLDSLVVSVGNGNLEGMCDNEYKKECDAFDLDHYMVNMTSLCTPVDNVFVMVGPVHFPS